MKGNSRAAEKSRRERELAEKRARGGRSARAGGAGGYRKRVDSYCPKVRIEGRYRPWEQ